MIPGIEEDGIGSRAAIEGFTPTTGQTLQRATRLEPA